MYREYLLAAQRPPPGCPKCGNHRTQVVDRSDAAKTLIVRCNACGVRSTVERSDIFDDGKQMAYGQMVQTTLEMVGD